MYLIQRKLFFIFRPTRSIKLSVKTIFQIQFKGNSKVVHANRLKVSHINQETKVKQEKHNQKMNNLIHVLITDVRVISNCLAGPCHHSVNRVWLRITLTKYYNNISARRRAVSTTIKLTQRYQKICSIITSQRIYRNSSHTM